MADKKLIRVVRYTHLKKFFAGVALVTFVVIFIAGAMAQARFFTIAIKEFAAMVAIAIICLVVIRVIASYEEMNGGKT